MNAYLIYITPIIGLLGIVTGALLQAFLNRKNKEIDFLSGLRNQAYSDFLNAVSKIAVAQRHGKRETVTNELANLADAKARICVYGESVVIEKLAAFFRKGSTLQTESEIQSFTRLCITFRESVMEEEDINPSDISQLLFSFDIADIKTPQSK